MLIHSDYFIPVNFNNTENKLKHKTIPFNSEKIRPGNVKG